LEIKLFNEQWFTGHLSMEIPAFVAVSMPLPYDDDPPDWQQAEQNENNAPIKNEYSTRENSPSIMEDIYKTVQHSRYKLFFIKYAASGPVRPKLYLIRIAETKACTAPIVMNATLTVEVMAKHINDMDRSDPDSCWWPELNEYTVGDGGIP
jgi:hypothetical protein